MTPRLVISAFLWCLLLSVPAEAYIDPSTGGSLVQLLLAGSAGVAVLGRLFWWRIMSAVGLKRRPELGRSAPDDNRV
jgi:hypothetical protein